MSAPSTRTRRLIQISGFGAVAFFLCLVARFWHPVYGLTALIQLDAPNEELKLPAFRQYPVFVHQDHGGYDGLYYAQIALDPTLRDPGLPRAIDNLSYRARRILPPALAWAGGLGRPDWIIRIYPWLNVIAWLALAAVLWRLLDVTTLRGLVAWTGVLFSAGALASVRLALTDLIALALLAAALLAAERQRGRAGVACLSLAVLSRETSVLGLAGLLTRPWFSRRNVAAVVAVAAPLALWLAYVRWRVGPADAGWSNLTLPVVGWIEKLIASSHALQTVQDRPLAWTTFLATLALSVQALYVVTGGSGRRPGGASGRRTPCSSSPSARRCGKVSPGRPPACSSPHAGLQRPRPPPARFVVLAARGQPRRVRRPACAPGCTPRSPRNGGAVDPRPRRRGPVGGRLAWPRVQPQPPVGVDRAARLDRG
jgi:hypothetical protein